MTDSMIEDLRVSDDETDKWVQKLQNNLKRREEEYKKEKEKNPEKKMSFYYPVRNAVWDTIKYEWYWIGAVAFCASACSLGYTAFLSVLIRHLKDPESTVVDGIWKACIGGVLILASVFLAK